MPILDPIRRAIVRVVKPHVSDPTWARIKTLDPRARNRGDIDPPPRPMAEWDLVSLAQHCGTDKWGVHRYIPHYEHHFMPFKHEKMTVLEIGIGGYAREKQGGASLRMWKAFFPNAQIVGLDIQDKSFVDEDRVKTYRGSQTDVALLRRIVDEAENLQIVIDDGSHRPEHIRATFEALLPLLPNGALYAIEDTQTSYWPQFGGSEDLDDKSTSMNLVKDMLDGLNYVEWYPYGYRPSYSDLHIVAVHGYHNLVILEKGENNEGTNRKAPTAPDA